MLNVLTLHPFAFGLDISDLSLKIVYMKKQRRGMALGCFGEFSIPPGAVVQGEILQKDVLAETLRNAARTLGKKLPVRHVVASLPEERAFLQVIQLPRMRETELEYAVRFEAENYIPYPLEKVCLDFQEVQPLMSSTDHKDVLLAALPKDTVEAYVSVIEQAGFMPRAFEVESLAIARALVFRDASAQPVLLVDFGATRTSFIVFSGHSVRFTASIPISSSQCTEAIAKACAVEQAKAEELKAFWGLEGRQDVMGQRVFEALIPPLSALMEQMKRHIEYYESHSSHQHLRVKGDAPSVRRVIVSGGGANIKGLNKFLARELGRDVVTGNPWVNILNPSAPKLPPLSLAESLRYTVPLGLAIRGAKEE